MIEAVASGEITPQEGQSVSAIVDARRRSWESMEMEEQISTLQDCADDARSNRSPKIIWTGPPRPRDPASDRKKMDEDQINRDVA